MSNNDLNEIQKAFEIMESVGVSINKRIEVRNLILKWASKNQIDSDIEYDAKNNFWVSKIKPQYSFDSVQEVALFNSILDIAPDANSEKVMQIMAIIFKLLDVKSDWSFSSAR